MIFKSPNPQILKSSHESKKPQIKRPKHQDQTQTEHLYKIEQEEWNQLSVLMEELTLAESDPTADNPTYDNQNITNILSRIRQQVVRMNLANDFNWYDWEEQYGRSL